LFISMWMFVRLLLMMGVVMLVCWHAFFGMRLIVIVDMHVFMTVLMGVDSTSRMCMFMVVGVTVCMGVFSFFHCSSSFLVLIV